jgi:hypothetical protein
MGKPNLKKVFLGLFLIVFALFSAVTAFYFLEVKPKMQARQARKARQTKIKTMKMPADREIKLNEKAAAETVRVNESVKPPARTVTKEKESKNSQPQIVLEEYSESERNRREGTLWIDKATGNYVATLGAVQGIKSGDRLDVYDGEQLIGAVEVKSMQAVFSFVQPVNDAIERSGKKYFSVLKP